MAAPFLRKNLRGWMGIAWDLDGIEIPSPALPLWREDSKASTPSLWKIPSPDSRARVWDPPAAPGRIFLLFLGPAAPIPCGRSRTKCGSTGSMWDHGIRLGTRDPRARALPSPPPQLWEHPKTWGWNLAAFLAFLLKINPGMLDRGRSP